MNGLAGTGKSTIAKTTAERLFADNRLGASFFCSRDFQDRRNLELIFPTLAIQLARKYPKFRSILIPLIQSDPGIAYGSLCDQMEKLIIQPLKESGISTVIVIDALDECEDEEPASAILSVLGWLASQIPQVKFFLTGRPEPQISKGFRLPLVAKVTDKFVLHEVKPNQVNSDIQLFLTSSFLELDPIWPGLAGWPTKEQLGELCRRAAGLFIYAAVTVKFISNNEWNPKKQLNILLESKKIGAHEGEDLDSLYTLILQKAFGGRRLKHRVMVCSILGAVVLAANPLSPSTISKLLGFDAEDVTHILSLVNSFLICQDDNHPVQLFHKSFPDFITDKSRCTDQRFYISPQDHHLKLLVGCLNLMNQTLEKNMCQLSDGVANSDVSDLKKRIEEHINPALQYACLSWHIHLVDADTTPACGSAITPTLHQFLETKFLFWLEVLSVFGNVRNAVDALQVIQDWLEVCSLLLVSFIQIYSKWIQESPTLDLARDCFNFVTKYFEIISASSTHIYHSALVVAPKESIVWNLYGSHAHPFIRVVWGAPILWDTNIAAVTRPSKIKLAEWSPCNRFIAITWEGARMMDVLDSATLQQLQAFELPKDISANTMALAFSPDSHILTCSSIESWEGEVHIISWDLQTGGIVSIIRHKCAVYPYDSGGSLTYSENGKMLGLYPYDSSSNLTSSGNQKMVGFSQTCDITIFNVAAGIHIHSHSLSTRILNIWAQGESLWFATDDGATIVIWEVGFTSDATPTKVMALQIPGGSERDEQSSYKLAHPLLNPSKVIITNQQGVQIWDVLDSKSLLKDYTCNIGYPSFSPDGRFFASSIIPSQINLWKESPTGYILHKKLASNAGLSSIHLSHDGKSIVVVTGHMIQLWDTEGFTTTPLTQAPHHTESFLLDFSPDRTVAVIAMQGDDTVMVLDLKSGILQLTIDTDMKVFGLRVIGNELFVIGKQKVVPWNLPISDCVPNARVTLKDSSQAMDIKTNSPILSISISPNSHHVAFVSSNHWDNLGIYSVSTRKTLFKSTTDGTTLWFSPDGCDIWCADTEGKVEVWRIIDNLHQSGYFTIGIDHLPEGCPWGSSFGYQVTNDWWILGPGGKRLLMLPPPWQSYATQQVWKGKFLALLHRGLSEPVILDLNP